MRNWPLVITHADVRRIFDRKASRLILTGAKVKPGTFDVQDAQIVRRNERYRKTGRLEQQQEPTVLTITIVEIIETPLVGLDFPTIHKAGFATQRDFYADWLERRRWIDPDEMVKVCEFGFADRGRFLHCRVHRGYTTEPHEAARDEPEALSAADLKALAGSVQRRYDREHREEIRAARVRSIAARMKLTTDLQELRTLSREFDRLVAEHEAAA